ncbi:hypothetical protein ACVIHH_003215 [Bradyrhizobium sp. USDA 4518]
MRSTSGSRTCSIIAKIFWRRARASRSVWARSTSSIWRPTGTTGLSAVIGSWKIIAIRVARSCRSRRSLAVSSSSPTSLTLPPDGTSVPFCCRPITVSDVTDLPEPLSPTRHSVSLSRTCSERSSMMRCASALRPRPTTRLLMSRTTLVMSGSLGAVKEFTHCHSGMVRQHQTRNLEIPGSMLRIAPE